MNPFWLIFLKWTGSTTQLEKFFFVTERSFKKNWNGIETYANYSFLGDEISKHHPKKYWTLQGGPRPGPVVKNLHHEWSVSIYYRICIYYTRFWKLYCVCMCVYIYIYLFVVTDNISCVYICWIYIIIFNRNTICILKSQADNLQLFPSKLYLYWSPRLPEGAVFSP